MDGRDRAPQPLGLHTGSRVVKVVILAGGLGTRLAEETEAKPKPMVEIGGRPILWHIMKHYASFGFREFVVALGYKGDAIKRYFVDYFTLNSDMTVDLSTGNVEVRSPECEPWLVHLVDTGLHTNTGGRIKRLENWLENETFMLTYGDGVANVDLGALLAFHRGHGRTATVTAVRPPSRFGGLIFDGDTIVEFTEKPQIGEGWINGGFLVLEPGVFRFLHGDDTSFEAGALEQLAERRELMAHQHDFFWQCMDTLRDVRTLNSMWETGSPAWKTWKDR
jgi:glucose-1-phosphate cytidylyltransferase